MGKIFLDEKGYQEYLDSIEEIREKIRKNGCEMSEYSSDDAYGDGWHDNFAYEQAMQKENALKFELNSRIKGLDDIVLVGNTNKSDIVDIDTEVELDFDGDIEKYIITGGYNSDFDRDIPIITLNSPLGSSIYKKKINDTFNYNVNEVSVSGKIISINKHND